jgi:hypothetical protein
MALLTAAAAALCILSSVTSSYAASCPRGSSFQAPNSKNCTFCSAGQYASEVNATHCEICPAGKFSKNDGSAECTSCEPGTFAFTGSKKCSNSPGRECQVEFGRWLRTQDDCKSCPAGRAASSPEASERESEQDSIECSICPLGSFSKIAIGSAGGLVYNVAQNATATQSSTDLGGEASRGIDGNMNGAYNGESCTHTDAEGSDQWWQIDLGGTYVVSAFNIYHRTDACCMDRLVGAKVIVSETVDNLFGSSASLCDTLELGGVDSPVESGQCNDAVGNFITVLLPKCFDDDAAIAAKYGAGFGVFSCPEIQVYCDNRMLQVDCPVTCAHKDQAGCAISICEFEAFGRPAGKLFWQMSSVRAATLGLLSVQIDSVTALHLCLLRLSTFLPVIVRYFVRPSLAVYFCRC